MHMGLGSLADEIASSSVVNHPQLNKVVTAGALDKEQRAALAPPSVQDPSLAQMNLSKQTSAVMAVRASNAPICRQYVMENAALMEALQRSGQSVESAIELCSRDVDAFKAQIVASGLEKKSSNTLLYVGGAVAGGLLLWALLKR